jgi:prolyl 4-hydroxylase
MSPNNRHHHHHHRRQPIIIWWWHMINIILVWNICIIIVVISDIQNDGDYIIHPDGTIQQQQQQQQQRQQQEILDRIDDSIDPSTSSQRNSSRHNSSSHHDDDDVIYYDNYHQYNYPKDPLLQRMPHYDFDAYVRPDVSTYYDLDHSNHNNNTNTNNNNNNNNNKQQHEMIPSFNGYAGKFINISPKRVSLYWVDVNHHNVPSVIDYEIAPWGSGGTATYPNHQFIMTEYHHPNDILCTFTIESPISVYYCNPYETTATETTATETTGTTTPTSLVSYQYSRRGILHKDHTMDYHTLSKQEQETYYKVHIQNLQFGDAYQLFTNGSPWLTMYPPNPLLHPIFATNYFGQTHTITTIESHFHSIPPNPTSYLTGRTTLLNHEQMKHPNIKMLQQYRNHPPLTLTLKVLSCIPKVLEIEHFLSETEVNHILQIVQHQTILTRSQTSDGQISSTRTSRTAWINRQTDYIINSIYRRVANVVNISEALLRPHTYDEVNDMYDNKNHNHTTRPHIQTLDTISEDIQIVHYDPNQEYASHHDFEYPTGVEPNHKKSRTLNLAMYLNTVHGDGGETSFPRYRNRHTSDALKVKPIKGKAILFYMVNPDGNLEDYSQHAGLPFHTPGQEKYFANLWLHTYS